MLGQARAQAVLTLSARWPAAEGAALSAAGPAMRVQSSLRRRQDAKMDEWLPVTATKPVARATTVRAMRWAVHSRTAALVSPGSPRTSN